MTVLCSVRVRLTEIGSPGDVTVVLKVMETSLVSPSGTVRVSVTSMV